MKYNGKMITALLKCGLGLLLLNMASSKILLETREKHIVLETRYAKMNASAMENDGTIAPVVVVVKSDLLPDSAPKKKTLLTFSDQRQKALINAYNGRAHTNDELKGLISGNYFTDDDKSNVIDFTTRTVSLTITVQNRDFFGIELADSTFADRLEKIRIKLALDQKDVFKFKAWNKVNTQFGKFYVGSRNYTGSQTGTLSPSLTVGTASLSLGSLAGTRLYGEADTVYEQYVSSNGILYDDNFVIEQDGTPKTTLIGNTVVQLTIKAKHIDSKYLIALDKLSDDDGKPSPGDKIKLTKKIVLFAIFSKADRAEQKLTGSLSFDYVLRHVNMNFRTFAENDDEITYKYGTVSDQPVDILGSQDLGKKFFYFTVDGQFVKLKNTAVADPAELFVTANFFSYDEALALLNWLLSHPDGDNVIKIAGTYYVGMIGVNGAFVPLSKNYLSTHKLLISEE